MVMSADVDIDLPDRAELLKHIKHISARLETGKPHNSGVYVTDIPVDPINNISSLDYKTAESRGYFKLDFLNMSVYKSVKSPEHYAELLNKEPNWSRLWTDTTWSQQLVHIGNYTELLKTMKPDNIQRMAAFISVIRPGKAYLQNKSWTDVFATVWDGDDSKGYTFKKSHSLGYAMLVALHMNLLDE